MMENVLATPKWHIKSHVDHFYGAFCVILEFLLLCSTEENRSHTGLECHVHYPFTWLSILDVSAQEQFIIYISREMWISDFELNSTESHKVL